jgi:microcystin-dependent protein
MSEPFLGEIKIFAFNFPPRGWAQCDGQILPINQNQSLYSLLGTTYGGDGRTSFALPDLRGRTPFHVGNGFALGQRGGEESHALSEAELASHTHELLASSELADRIAPQAGVWANGGINVYADVPDVSMSSAMVTATGNAAAHENRQPYRTLNFCIALVGIFPPRN